MVIQVGYGIYLTPLITKAVSENNVNPAIKEEDGEDVDAIIDYIYRKFPALTIEYSGIYDDNDIDFFLFCKKTVTTSSGHFMKMTDYVKNNNFIDREAIVQLSTVVSLFDDYPELGWFIISSM